MFVYQQKYIWSKITGLTVITVIFVQFITDYRPLVMESLNCRSDKHDRQGNAEKVGLKIVNKSESYITNLI